MPFSLSQLIAGTLLFVAAAAWDISKRRIPNALNGALILAGLWAHASAQGWQATGGALAAAAITLALLWIPWSRRRLGGGDVKMAVGVAAWMGLSLLPAYYLSTALAGGLVAVICYTFSTRGARDEIKNNLAAMTAGAGLPQVPLKGGSGRLSVPYGVAVALAGLVLLWKERLW
jgi:Flp pilus assembly protein protease CpaA